MAAAREAKAGGRLVICGSCESMRLREARPDHDGRRAFPLHGAIIAIILRRNARRRKPWDRRKTREE
jgi:hypothetical protein